MREAAVTIFTIKSSLQKLKAPIKKAQWNLKLNAVYTFGNKHNRISKDMHYCSIWFRGRCTIVKCFLVKPKVMYFLISSSVS